MNGPKTIEQWAEHYRCSPRTIVQLRTEGVDLRDPTAVAIRLVNTQAPALPMLERVGELLEETENQ